MQRSFIKNVKERKERNILFIKNAKERENARSFEKNGCPTLLNGVVDKNLLRESTDHFLIKNTKLFLQRF